MTIAGTHPEQGVRVALDLISADDKHAHYRGEAFTPFARHELTLDVDVTTGAASLHLGEVHPRVGGDAPAPPSTLEGPPSLPGTDLAFIRQLGKQMWRQVQLPREQGGGEWSRRVQRWRGAR